MSSNAADRAPVRGSARGVARRPALSASAPPASPHLASGSLREIDGTRAPLRDRSEAAAASDCRTAPRRAGRRFEVDPRKLGEHDATPLADRAARSPRRRSSDRSPPRTGAAIGTLSADAVDPVADDARSASRRPSSDRRGFEPREARFADARRRKTWPPAAPEPDVEIERDDRQPGRRQPHAEAADARLARTPLDRRERASAAAAGAWPRRAAPSTAAGIGTRPLFASFHVTRTYRYGPGAKPSVFWRSPSSGRSNSVPSADEHRPALAIAAALERQALQVRDRQAFDTDHVDGGRRAEVDLEAAGLLRRRRRSGCCRESTRAPVPAAG